MAADPRHKYCPLLEGLERAVARDGKAIGLTDADLRGRRSAWPTAH